MYCGPRVDLQVFIWPSEQFEFETPGLDEYLKSAISSANCEKNTVFVPNFFKRNVAIEFLSNFYFH